MSALIFKFCLPILLGYTLFVGLSGRFIPFIRPAKLSARPSWFLGLWTGLTVSIITGVALHLAYQMPLDTVKTLAKPTGLLLAVAWIPGLLMYILYKQNISQENQHQESPTPSSDELAVSSDLHRETAQADVQATTEASAEIPANTEVEAEAEAEADINVSKTTDEILTDTDIQITAESESISESINLDEAESELETSEFDLDVDFDDTLITKKLEESDLVDVFSERNDLLSVSSPEGELGGRVLEESVDASGTDFIVEAVHTSEPLHDSAELHDSADLAEQQPIKTLDSQEATFVEHDNDVEHLESAKLDDELLAEQRAAAHHLEQQLAEEQRLRTEQLQEQSSINSELSNEVTTLKQALDAETQLRTHTETHLRITRKALKNLEGDTRSFETDKADALMEVEEQLEAHVKETSAAMAQANREENLRITAETAIVNMKQDLLSAKRELRRNTEARAKALSTANKSVAFARQSVQSRTRAEARIKQLESRLKLSQETVSSLIAALDKEKARTQNDVTEMAKELILQQKRLDEKRTLDEAGRRTQKRLTRRIAKKVS